MPETLRVTWRVTPLQPPLVRRHCSRCAAARAFACSLKFRTNAQKKRLDVWLIYRCSACAAKNHMRARYCDDCGHRLAEQRGDLDERGRPRLYADISHPINQHARDQVQNRILEAYHEELERSKQEGYVAKSFDDLDYDYLEDYSSEER